MPLFDVASQAPGMAKLFDLVLGSDTATIDTGASGIATDYSNLLIHAYIKTAYASSWVDNLTLTFNNDSGANYDYAYTYSSNGSTSETTSQAQTNIQAVIGPGSNGSTQNYFSAIQIAIPNYANTSFWKTGTGQSGVLDTGSSSQNANVNFQFGYRSTSAISRLAFGSSHGSNLKASSRVTIYGLP